ncbi:cyanophycin synthetase, partial [bacterium]|nr:cyanophycin synthetase [candidate division CSSED10-310 bacterium]
MKKALIITNKKLYLGPNTYLDQQAITLHIEFETNMNLETLWHTISQKIPEFKDSSVPKTIGELFARTAVQVQQLNMNLFANKWTSQPENGYEVVAFQYIDPVTGDRTVDFVCDWINDIVEGREFPFKVRLTELEHLFSKSSFGGPTIYSIIEAGYKNGIPMFYIKSEDVFQWGQGRKQLRGRSTVLHRDSIKDTELTSFKDLAKNFLDDLGFPVPKGMLCYSLREAENAADQIGYPVVTKPVSGHKGQGVSTNLTCIEDVRIGFEIARDAGENRYDPIIVEKYVVGTDHRLLTISGKFVAALQRIPAYVVGNGELSIEELIHRENNRSVRADTPRSALGKIKIDDDLVSFIREKGLSLSDIPAENEIITLRRVANLSAGGVSVNVTDKIHPLNIKLAEDVARFLDVHVLGIDLLSEDIAKPWTETS